MIAAHIDQDLEYIVREIWEFERERGTVMDFINNSPYSSCNMCGRRAEPNDTIDYVITSSGSIIWWHRLMKSTDSRCSVRK